MKYVLSLLAVVFINSCATDYQSRGMTGGYVDTQLSETLWKVTVNGNAYTSSSTVGDYALLRASELTLEKGYKYFVIASDNQNKSSSVAKFGGNTSNTYGNFNNNTGNFNATTNYQTPTYVPMNKYENTMVYEMFNEKIDGTFLYDAQLIYDSLSAKYMN